MQKAGLPVVILAGGRGLRLDSQAIPKPLVKIGSYAVIQHVMNIYAFYGHTRFILSVGYKGNDIREFFETNNSQNFDIQIVDTGLETPTGGRIKGVEEYIDTDDFFATYCDGLADINIRKEYEYHQKEGKIATLAVVHPMSPFGIVEIGSNGMVSSFKEKPFMPSYINGGFFIFNKRFFDYVDVDSTLEEEPLKKVAAAGQLAAYRHEGFWACMDTFKDVKRLNDLWNTGIMPHTGFRGKAPWTQL